MMTAPSVVWATSGVELERVDFLFHVAHGPELDGVGLAHADEPFGQPFHAVAVGHPHGQVILVLDALEQDAVVLRRELGATIFAVRGGHDLAAEVVGQQLHAVADAEHRNTHVEVFHVQLRASPFQNGRRPAGQDQRRGLERLDPLGVHVAGVNLGIDPGLAHAARDKLGELAAKIKDKYSVVVHVSL